ncbi:hypothetical protein [Bacillus smithii]|nr:hypothetical protein [Bacillus smithii]MED4928851.1 hypothetical protein [Bacillus smithii]
MGKYDNAKWVSVDNYGEAIRNLELPKEVFIPFFIEIMKITKKTEEL